MYHTVSFPRMSIVLAHLLLQCELIRLVSKLGFAVGESVDVLEVINEAVDRGILHEYN